jgi:ppGpp synthetase/RelA/SpoT-type nucleotidyltranferase
VDLNGNMPWSRRRLKKLGEALVERSDIPEDCPRYDDVMLWHDDLAGEVQAIIAGRRWNSVSQALQPTARSKTYDTLVQKLEREKDKHLSLDVVQDLAGVRVDIDCSLGEQLALVKEMAAHFGRERSNIRDIRSRAHSGYRAVHVWLRLPAGRIEVQVRTLAQSAWANTYERMADLFGRGIRYGEVPEDQTAHKMFDFMQRVSNDIADMERAQQHVRDMQADVDEQRDAYTPLADVDEFDQLESYRGEVDRYARFARLVELDQRALEGYKEGYDPEVYQPESDDPERDQSEGDQSEKYDDELASYDRLELNQRAYERYERDADRLLKETRADLNNLGQALDALEKVFAYIGDNR